MKITVTLLHDRRNKLKDQSNDTAPIDIQIYQSAPKLRKFIGSGISIEAQYWDGEKRQVNKKDPSAPHYNKILRDATQAIENYAYSLFTQNIPLTNDLLTEFLNGRKPNNESFTEFFAQEIDPALKRGTRKEHQYTYNILCEFKPSILFSEINYAFTQEFDRFMRFEKKFMQNTIHKHHAHVNRFLRQAALKELFDPNKNPYNTFKRKKATG